MSKEEIAYPACYGPELPQALRVTKEWVASVEYCMSIAVLPIPSSDAVIAAVSKFADGRLLQQPIVDASLEVLRCDLAAR